MIKAVLFDFDGVLIDSEKAIFLAMNNYLESQNITGVTQENVKAFTGAGEDYYFDSIIKKYDLRESRDNIVEIVLNNFMTQLEGFDFFPGLIELITFFLVLKNHDIKVAVVTSASRSLTLRKIKKLGLDFSMFDLIVNGESVKNNKPAPHDIYKHAGKLLHTDMSNCLVVEDAINGVKAGKNRSGAIVNL